MPDHSFKDIDPMRSVFVPLLALLIAVPACNVQAAGDAVAGEKLFYTCTGCHGIAGYKNAYPNYSVPKVGGQSETYLINALKAYQKGDRKHPTMGAQAQSMNDQDIADIAAFLSNVK
ncbi:MAG: cytochrome C [Lysobacterales bacterium CG02_land_8_20_14_3_00_62_12]|nr:MAG: cytochrome C [Xanthomonadales bacterium CG02_land_8_20_14_3_00_62_12]PJA41928.1 MAG: cytochrome C [Xanthomonadales bacterium CG_4_9_14_3_um_filter_62_6]